MWVLDVLVASGIAQCLGLLNGQTETVRGDQEDMTAQPNVVGSF